MTETIPPEFDVVIVGSGAAAMTGAVTAGEAGLSVLLLESTDKWGGTSAVSGGGFWVPDHALMETIGMQDSREDALDYLRHAVGDSGPSTSAANLEAFVDSGPAFSRFLSDLGMRLEATLYPDYYQHLPGARVGRGLASPNVDGREIGADLATLRAPPNRLPLVFERSEFLALLAPFRRKRHFLTLARIMLRTLGWKLRGRAPLNMGMATMAELMRMARRFDMTMRLDADVYGFGMEDGRAAWVHYRHGGTDHRVRARKAILVAAGGFARNDAMRRRHQPVGNAFTATAPGDLGGALAAGIDLGAQVALMDESWWMPVVSLPDGTRAITLTERSMPHSLIVDRAGQRFLNEAQPYCDCGRAMLDHLGADHGWLILDSRNRANYAFCTLGARQSTRPWTDAGVMIEAPTIADLARQTGIDAAALTATLDRFNHFARTGVDEDFRRGASTFDNGWGDPYHGPNPNLGAVEKPPFYAVKIWPGDLGTKGGLLTDADARVLDMRGAAIPSLYAAGNAAATPMGSCYPGPGGTLGPGMVFAWRAMRHAATVEAS